MTRPALDTGRSAQDAGVGGAPVPGATSPTPLIAAAALRRVTHLVGTLAAQPRQLALRSCDPKPKSQNPFTKPLTLNLKPYVTKPQNPKP
jgi:hypothetical protein